MNKIMNKIYCIAIAFFSVLLLACSDETIDKGGIPENAAELNISVDIDNGDIKTRVTELGSLDNMNEWAKGKQYIGLYIYYQSDYDNETPNLGNPYIRNLKCKIEGGKLVPVDGSKIYIYDHMRIVAFYPYNEEMSEQKNWFTNKIEEDKYPISESDYERQTYIPYRATTTVNPTNAYMVQMGFSPVHTCKIQIVLVAKNPASFPSSGPRAGQTLEEFKKNGELQILPAIDKLADSYDGTNDRREYWVDHIEDYSKSMADEGGLNVMRYTAYLWKSPQANHHDSHPHDNNRINKGDILFKSDKLTLIVPNDVELGQQVYRYGYNMDNGEIFIPTADILTYDTKSLQDVSFGENAAFQVCDIDLAKLSGEWKPLTTHNGRYDGGGHAIKDLKIDATAKPGDVKTPIKQQFGLFGKITGTSTLKNIYLVDPQISVNGSSSVDTCYVGAVCGQINPALTKEEIEKMIRDGLPPELSETIKKALIEKALADFKPTTCTAIGCKVQNPVITVTGEAACVGSICGGAGQNMQMAAITDSYSSLGRIQVNMNNKTQYNKAYVGGFCGLSSAIIKHCYTTTTAEAYITTTSENVGTGFANLDDSKNYPKDKVVKNDDCYTTQVDNNTGIKNFSGAWPTAWPLYKDTPGDNNSNKLDKWPAMEWKNYWRSMGINNSEYPTLIWEKKLLITN